MTSKDSSETKNVHTTYSVCKEIDYPELKKSIDRLERANASFEDLSLQRLDTLIAFRDEYTQMKGKKLPLGARARVSLYCIYLNFWRALRWKGGLSPEAREDIRQKKKYDIVLEDCQRVVSSAQSSYEELAKIYRNVAECKEACETEIPYIGYIRSLLKIKLSDLESRLSVSNQKAQEARAALVNNPPNDENGIESKLKKATEKYGTANKLKVQANKTAKDINISADVLRRFMVIAALIDEQEKTWERAVKDTREFICISAAVLSESKIGVACELLDKHIQSMNSHFQHLSELNVARGGPQYPMLDAPEEVYDTIYHRLQGRFETEEAVVHNRRMFNSLNGDLDQVTAQIPETLKPAGLLTNGSNPEEKQDSVIVDDPEPKKD